MTDQNQQPKQNFSFGALAGGTNPFPSTGAGLGGLTSNINTNSLQKTNSQISFGTGSGFPNAKNPVPSDGSSNNTGTTTNVLGADNSKNTNFTASAVNFNSNPFQSGSSNTTSLGNNLITAKPQGDQNTQKPTTSLFGCGENKPSFSNLTGVQNTQGTNQSGQITSNNIFSGLSNQTNQNLTNKPTNPLGGGNPLAFTANATTEKSNNLISNSSNPSISGFSFNPNQNSNGLETNKTSSGANITGFQIGQTTNTSESTQLNRGISFGFNKNTNAAENNSTDKAAETTNNSTGKTNSLGLNQPNTGFGSILGSKSLTNLAKPEETANKQATTGLFSKPLEQPKSSDVGTAKEDTQKQGLFFNMNNSNPLTKPSNETNSKTETGNIEKKPIFGNISKPDSTINLAGNISSKDGDTGITNSKVTFGFGTKPAENSTANLKPNEGASDTTTTAPKINFGFGAKTAENTTTTKTNEGGSILNKDSSTATFKKENGHDTQTQTKSTFVLPNTKKESLIDNKQQTGQNPKDLFSSQQPKTDGSKIEQKPDSKDTGKKEESKNKIKLNSVVKLSDPKEMPKISNTLDEVAINSMMKKSIEEVINHWKNELDIQVDRYDTCGDKLKNFEFMFRKHFETICSLYELINNLKEDGNNTLRNLKDISLEEDQIIEQLNIMENSLDQYLELADNRQVQAGRSQQNDGRDHIYFTATEIANTVDEIQKDIDEVNSKISEGNVINKEENLNVLSYENPLLKESISMDKNEFTNILNSYYASLRSIQFMEQNLVSKIIQAEVELNEIRRERERDKY
jgi:hypothetical protein